MAKDPRHYVDNKEFLEAFKQYKQEIAEAQENGEQIPRVPDYIGECFLKIAQHLSYRPNFINYTYKHDMISDGVENCLMYCKNFDPEKSSNPFAYFTQIIYYAFLRRIQREKKQTELKARYVNSLQIDEEMFINEFDDLDPSYKNTYVEYLRSGNLVGDTFLKEQNQDKETQKEEIQQEVIGLENFMDDKE